MKYKISLSISALCFFMAFLISLAGRAQSQEALADRISPQYSPLSCPGREQPLR